MDVGQRRGRVHAELVGQQLPGLLVHVERVALPPGQVQHPHELAAQPFAQRVRGGQFLQLRGQSGAAAEGQVRLEPVLGGGQPEFFQPGHRPGRERRVGHVGQRRAAPQPQRLAQHRRPCSRSPAGQPRARATPTSRSNSAASTCSGGTASW